MDSHKFVTVSFVSKPTSFRWLNNIEPMNDRQQYTNSSILNTQDRLPYISSMLSKGIQSSLNNHQKYCSNDKSHNGNDNCCNSATSITTAATSVATATTTSITTAATSVTTATTSVAATTRSVTTTTTSVTTATTSVTTTTTSVTTATTSVTTTTTTTTAQAPAVAQSSPASYCGCSGINLSLSSILFNTTSATYKWQSSPTGQNIWSNINTPSSSSSFYESSQVNSSDYQCQIIVLYPTVRNLTSTIVTVLSSINTIYCQTSLDDCSSYGDNINNFILHGESGTQINDLGTNCSANSYDNRTQESVSLYENTNYTAQISTLFPGGTENLMIWIDFNNNFQFESTEQVAYQILVATSNTNVIVAIPSSSQGATIGVHRMRATLAFSSIPNPCGTSSLYGETHDYTVDILSLPG